MDEAGCADLRDEVISGITSACVLYLVVLFVSDGAAVSLRFMFLRCLLVNSVTQLHVHMFWQPC